MVVVTGRVGYLGPVTVTSAASGRVTVTTQSGRSVTAPIVGGVFRFHLRPGTYRIWASLTKPRRSECPPAYLTVPVGRRQVTADLNCALDR